jgi:hypothetical protein
MHKVLTVEGTKRAAFKESHRSDKAKLAFVMAVMKLLLKIALPVSVRTEAPMTSKSRSLLHIWPSGRSAGTAII